MNQDYSFQSRRLAEAALLKGAADDLLADFERAYYVQRRDAHRRRS